MQNVPCVEDNLKYFMLSVKVNLFKLISPIYIRRRISVQEGQLVLT